MVQPLKKNKHMKKRTKKFFILNSQGQALIEFTMSSFLTISLVTTGTILIYMSFIKYFNHVELYNAILCVAKQRPTLLCKYNLKKSIENNLFFRKVKQIHLAKKNTKITGKAKWAFWGWTFKNKMTFYTSSLTKKLPIIKE